MMFTVAVLGAHAFADTDADPGEVLRTPWGAPKLAGTWDFSTLTPFERPLEFGDKALLTPEETKAFLERGHEVLGCSGD